MEESDFFYYHGVIGGLMNFTEKEAEWLKLCIEDNDKYRLVVDNDSVWVDKNMGYGEFDCVFTFNDYGQDFIVKILNYIGCNAENC